MKIIKRKDALKQGLVRYFTGKPCVNGHIDERTSINGMCCQCQRETAAARWSSGSSWVQKDKSRATEAFRPQRSSFSLLPCKRSWQEKSSGIRSLRMPATTESASLCLRRRFASWRKRNDSA